MKSEAMEIVGRFQLGRGRKSLPLEVLGLERCFQFLKPGGKLGIVLPDGILKNKNASYVRAWLHEVAEVKAVISLPIETFAPFGAVVKTSLCFFRKAKEGERPDPSAKTFLAEVESLGYDATVSSVDVETGAIVNPQELSGAEAPSRARMRIHAQDVIVSTCRPTRGAIAVVPPDLHDQICSTGFTVLRCKEDVNPFFLQYVLRLPSTLEQFRKFSTGSSYPAILATDVLKTLVPGASIEEQDAIAASTVSAFEDWKRTVHDANERFRRALSQAETVLRQAERTDVDCADNGPS